MENQSYASHRRWVPAYHFVLAALLTALLVVSIVLLVRAFQADAGVLAASMNVAMVVAMFMMGLFLRAFPVRAQDRLIRTEESFRHYLATGKPLDPRTTIRQAIGLRFASDEEFVELAKRAVETGMSETDIKKAIKTWRVDNYRV